MLVFDTLGALSGLFSSAFAVAVVAGLAEVEAEVDAVAEAEAVVDGLDLPLAALWSASCFWVLYSIRFCSKLGSLRYSSREPASETGACPKYDRTKEVRNR